MFQFSINVIRTVNVVVFLNFFEFLLRSNTFSINVNENITVNTHTHTHKHNVMSFYLETRVQNWIKIIFKLFKSQVSKKKKKNHRFHRSWLTRYSLNTVININSSERVGIITRWIKRECRTGYYNRLKLWNMFPLCWLLARLAILLAVLRISTLPIEYTANLKLWRIILGRRLAHTVDIPWLAMIEGRWSVQLHVQKRDKVI